MKSKTKHIFWAVFDLCLGLLVYPAGVLLACVVTIWSLHSPNYITVPLGLWLLSPYWLAPATVVVFCCVVLSTQSQPPRTSMTEPSILIHVAGLASLAFLAWWQGYTTLKNDPGDHDHYDY